ncbi:hypothetical protein [Streptomyces sp. NBC_00102]|uniref:hypothetical protein n=1 Tax=Streptomyces sp. NBC_00102 TaxID=2975652 RepID=UPI0022558862|nr:hypothetical protein [Streptomyces sp. NBC_00102]MCX5401181.1 hypothetical protein [Streptomyces sp. NBC_00102]
MPPPVPGPRQGPGRPDPDAPSVGGAPAFGRQGVGGPRFTAHRAGGAWLVAPVGPVDPRALAFTAGLAPDAECTVVVADLPDGSDDATLDRLVRAIPAGSDDLRFVFGRPLRRDAVTVAQHLAGRLGRTVIAAAGAPLPTPGGGLWVGPDSGPGWMRCAPGGPRTQDSRAFPKPSWEPTVPPRPWAIGRSVAEPLPAGVWLRPSTEDPARSARWTRLAGGPAVSTELMTVAIGAPGAPALPVADIARFWEDLPPWLRPAVRFLCYGPARLSGGRHLGDVLAQVVGEPVRFLSGMPQDTGDRREVVLTTDDGTPGRPLRAHEFVHLPPAGFPAPPPSPFAAAHRWPLGAFPEIRPGTHRLADDVVVEVVRSGLWVRPTPAPAHAPQMRDADPDPAHERVLCDAASEEHLPRLRRLAQDLVRSFPPGLRGSVRLGTGRPTAPAGRASSQAFRAPLPGAARSPAAPYPGPVGRTSPAAEAPRGNPGPAEGAPDPSDALAAVLRRLAGEGAPDVPVTSMVGNTPGPTEDVLLGRGLRMLPLLPGPTGLRATLDEPMRRWYAEQAVVTDPHACEASTLGPAGAPGNTAFLILSVNGRSTESLDPLRPDRVIFLPGSRFRVLEAGPGATGVVMMRELAPEEPPLDRVRDAAAVRELTRAWQDWRAGRPGTRPGRH